MLTVILILQLVIIGYLFVINDKLPKRDFVQEALDRDEKLREQREKPRYNHDADS
ncbi:MULTISPECIES: hypothetical protein [Paenibacillus]|uniref:hypothetical protein n=1 Tax=Paenibacillus TaxID=44249 RepID=UPI0015953B41|nr:MULTISPECIES: hypothetical protein [Paenibacillus]